MKRYNFFCDKEAAKLIMDGLHYSHSAPTMEISVDFVNDPFFFVFSGNSYMCKATAFLRSPFGCKGDDSDVELGTLTLDKSTGAVTGYVDDPILELNVEFFFEVCRKISCYAYENDFNSEFGELDSDEGIKFTANGMNLSCGDVKGKERPDLMCCTMPGQYAMMRPYSDESGWLGGFDDDSDDESLEKMIEKAENGNTSSMVDVAMYYLDECDEPDGEKAVYWFEKAANAGNSDAMFNTGLHYAKGFGVERNFEKSLYWMKKADENGDEDAENYIIRLTEAINAEKTADTGDAKAQAVLAEFYMYLGKSFDQAGNEKDYAKAFEYAKKSSDSNEGHGCWILALCYQHGRGVRPDARKAFELYQKGSDLGHAACQHSLACHYFRGEIVGQDFKKGFDLCMKSAKQGYGLAMADIGRCYQFGNGVEENMNVAIKWYEKSLEVEYDPELAEKVRIYKTFDDYEDVDIDIDID